MRTLPTRQTRLRLRLWRVGLPLNLGSNVLRYTTARTGINYIDDYLFRLCCRELLPNGLSRTPASHNQAKSGKQTSAME